MKTENYDITDARSIGQKSGLSEPGDHKNSGLLIPAGILIGLGIGILVDHIFSLFLVGFGLGLLGTGVLPLFRGRYRDKEETDVTQILIGAFMILMGISFVFTQITIWPYAFAAFLILAGIGFLVRDFTRKV